MRLTRRGKVVAGATAGGFLLALLFGARALNAVVVPGLVALAAGYVQVRARDAVRVRRETPGDGFAGETGTVTLTFADLDGDEVARPFVATVRELLGDGLAAAGEHAAPDGSAVFEAAVGSEPLTYEVAYERRGERSFGPVRVTATDVLGLVERDLRCPGTDSVLVFPRVRRLSRWGRENLLRLEEMGRSRERAVFEELREYDPGDPLRDIHWKTTAKRDELVVKEFAAAVDAETVRLAAGATGDADRMAEAVGSLAFALLDDGVPVEVHTRHGTVEVGPETGGTPRLLRLLAVVGAGRVPDVDADVVVRGDAAGATVHVGDREFDFAELVGDVPPETGGWRGARLGDPSEVAA